MSYQIEMLWRCGACRAENKGRFKKCQSCGRAKTDDDKFYMPGDTSRSATIEDAALLKKALAGPDWTCGFCGSAQGKLDGKCRNCGAKIDDAVPAEPPPLRPPRDEDFDRGPAPPKLGIVLLLMGVAALGVVILWLVFHTRVVDAHVASVAWTHKVVIDRWQVWRREGFDQDHGAFNVRDEGRRIHHYDHVIDHYRTEHYTEQVACGQSCTPIPRSCYTTPRSCTSNGNGFATCSGGNTVCSGGGQSCSTRYCTEARTRQVAVYRDDPVYRDYYSWSVWDWGYNRTVQHTGTTTKTDWPSQAEIDKGALLHDGEKERNRREESYAVVFADEDDKWTYDPKTERNFERFPVASKHKLKVGIASGVQVVDNGS